MKKTIDLFGGEAIQFPTPNKSKKKNLFTDHDGFVEKFEAKKTTDDCYTPDDVFALVLDYVSKHYDLTGKVIMRPFYPGGDFELVDYTENCVVVDNPPFSIISKIARFYIDNGIKFFLFAPHLTLFSSDIDCTHIVVGGSITYENGATVKTSFLSNMFGGVKIIGDADLLQKFKDLEAKKKVNLPKYEYPDHVLTVSNVQWIIERGISISINKEDVLHYRGLDAQKVHGKSIFGSGFLLSNQAAQEKAAQEKAAQEKDSSMVWELSDREKKMIEKLGRASTTSNKNQL